MARLTRYAFVFPLGVARPARAAYGGSSAASRRPACRRASPAFRRRPSRHQLFDAERPPSTLACGPPAPFVPRGISRRWDLRARALSCLPTLAGHRESYLNPPPPFRFSRTSNLDRVYETHRRRNSCLIRRRWDVGGPPPPRASTANPGLQEHSRPTVKVSLA